MTSWAHHGVPTRESVAQADSLADFFHRQYCRCQSKAATTERRIARFRLAYQDRPCGMTVEMRGVPQASSRSNYGLVGTDE